MITLKQFSLILLIVLIVLKIFYISYTPVTYDEFAHYYASKYIINNLESFEGKEIIPFYTFAYMPLFYLTIAPFLIIFPLLIIRYVPLLITLITIYFLYKFFKPIDESGLIAVITGFIPTIFVFTAGFYTDSLFLMWFVITLYFFKEKNKIWMVTMIFLILTKQFLSLSIIFPLLIITFVEDRWRDLLKATAISFVGFIYQFFIIRSASEIVLATWLYFNSYFLRALVVSNFILPTVLYLLIRPEINNRNKVYMFLPLSLLPMLIMGSIEFRWWMFASIFTVVPIYMSFIKLKLNKIGIMLSTILLISLFFLTMLTGTYSYLKWFGIQTNELSGALDFIKTLPKESVVLASLPFHVYYYANVNSTYDVCKPPKIDYIWINGGNDGLQLLHFNNTLLNNVTAIYNDDSGNSIFKVNYYNKTYFCTENVIIEITEWIKVGFINETGSFDVTCPSNENKNSFCEFKEYNLNQSTEIILATFKQNETLLISYSDESNAYTRCIQYNGPHICGGSKKYEYEYYTRLSKLETINYYNQ